MARDGTDVRLISGNIDSDHRPQVLADGRIIFTRWDYGIEKNVFFASNTMDTRRFLAIINVFVFYSLEEGLGLSLLEAMAAGKPCVASGVGGISSVIEDNVTGLLVPPKDPHALKEGILRVLKDASLGAYLAEKGKALIKKKFSLEKMVTEVMDVYQEDSAR